MVKIQVDKRSESSLICIEGNLTGDAVDELRRVWASVRNEAPTNQTVVDLTSVRSVDSSGRKLLSQMHSWGTRLTGKGLMIGPLIEEITDCK